MTKYTSAPKPLTVSEVIDELPAVFERGVESGELLYFESDISEHVQDGIPVRFFPRKPFISFIFFI